MVFSKKAISEFQKPSLSKQGEVQKSFLCYLQEKRKSFEISLVLKQRLGANRKWPRLTGFVDPLLVLKGVLSFEISHLHGDGTFLNVQNAEGFWVF